MSTLFWLGAESRGRSRVIALAAAVVVIAAVGMVAISPTAFPWAEAWWSIAFAPAFVAAMIVSVAGLQTILQWRGVAGAHVPLPSALLASTPAGRVAIFDAVERGRDAHAQWLHEDVLPRLSAGLVSLDAGDTTLGAAELHALAHDLRADIDHEQLTVLRYAGLPAALEDLLTSVQAVGLEATWSSRCEDGSPPWHVQVAALRIGQEAVRNALRHASADRIAIDTDLGVHHLHLSVTDDGVGLDAGDLRLARQAGHIGIPTMSARAKDADATLDLLPNEPRGLRVVFRWTR